MAERDRPQSSPEDSESNWPPASSEHTPLLAGSTSSPLTNRKNTALIFSTPANTGFRCESYAPLATGTDRWPRDVGTANLSGSCGISHDRSRARNPIWVSEQIQEFCHQVIVAGYGRSRTAPQERQGARRADKTRRIRKCEEPWIQNLDVALPIARMGIVERTADRNPTLSTIVSQVSVAVTNLPDIPRGRHSAKVGTCLQAAWFYRSAQVKAINREVNACIPSKKTERDVR